MQISPHTYTCVVERECGVNDLSQEGRSSGSAAQFQCSVVGEGCPDLPLPCGSDFHSRIQEAVMTTTRTETISLSHNCLFHRRLPQQLCFFKGNLEFPRLNSVLYYQSSAAGVFHYPSNKSLSFTLLDCRLFLMLLCL